jgi:mannosyltransferase
MGPMTATVSRGRPLSVPTARRLAASRLPELLAVALVMAWAVHARTRDLGATMWIDEGISFGVAQHAFTAIPGVLRQDGAPPLFYLVLHVWASIFGASARTGHALTLLFAVLAVPAGYWAARGPFGAWAGVLTAAIVGLDPFAGTYAIEVRMYSLLLLLGLVATGAFLRAFILHPGHRGWAAVFGLALAAVMYTHNWGLFFALATGVAWLVLVAAAGEGRRALLVAGVIGFGTAVVLFAPWVPTVLDQAAHTGAPWSHAPSWPSVGRAFQRLLGGSVPETVLLLFALAGAVQLLRPWSPTVSRAALIVLGIALGTFAIAFGWSNLSSPAWALRYLSIVLAPAAIVLGAGLSRLGVIAAVVLGVVFLGNWYGEPTHSALARKSNAELIAHRLGRGLPAGTQVFSTQPEQIPVLKFYLPAGLRYATPLGPVPDPRVMNWRDAMKRLGRHAALLEFPALLARLKPGEQLLLVQPHFAHPSAPWTRRIRTLTRAVRRELAASPGIRVVRTVVPHRGYTRATLSGLLLQRRDGAPGAAIRR